MPSQNNSQSSLFRILLFPALVIIGLIIIAIVVMNLTGGQQTASRPGDGPRQVSSQAMQTLRAEYDQLAESMGNENAPVVIREFGDYQCPACAQFEPTAERLREEYADNGQVRFLFYDFPLPMHPHAQEAAVAAHCASRQGQFWPYHNRLYGAQDQWSQQDDPTSTFLDLALETGLNTDEMSSCIQSQAPLAHINAERDAAQAVSLRATPTIMVNDQQFIGGTSYERLKQAIEQALPNNASS